jgi:hypothetical protein
MMKYLNKIIVLLVFSLAFISCDENENFEILPAQESFQIVTPSNGSVIVLNDTNLNNNALFISWEALSTATGPFKVEAAKTGTDFATTYLMGTTEAQNFGLTVDELNDFLLDVMGLEANVASSIDLRISANEELSKVVSVILTPYIPEFPELYLVGSLTGWDPGTAKAMTRLDFNQFEITIDLADGDEFKFLPTNTGWDGDFGKDPNNDGMLIQEGESNISGLAAGKYKISVNMTLFTYTAEFIPPPADMYMVGAGVPAAGWGWNSPIVLAQIQDGVFQGTTEFINDTFRFFTVNEDWGSGLNYPYYISQGYTIDANFEDAFDGDNNFRFIGTPGNYTMTLNNNDKTIVVSQIPLNIAVPGNHQGWNPGAAPLLQASVLGKTDYEGFVWLDGSFKFIAPNGNGVFEWGNLDWGDNGTSSGVLVSEGESDCVATAGYYYVKADTEALTYSIQETNWGVIGNATPTGWDSDTDMIYDAASGTWSVTLDLTAQAAPDNGIKFRANDGWDLNIGDNDADGTMEFNGQNIGISVDGNYTITLDLSNPRAYTYSIVLN